MTLLRILKIWILNSRKGKDSKGKFIWLESNKTYR